jgi:3-deoxy-D-manno-octulosonate 8-phosphate phosphatase (KDO 8-P phosphatase)
VFTDGGLHHDEDGTVVMRFDVRDGLSLRMLQRAGITVVLLSNGRSGAIEHRARHLDIEHCRTGVAYSRGWREINDTNGA